MNPYDWELDPGAIGPGLTKLEDVLLDVINQWYIEQPFPSTLELAQRCARVAQPFALAELLLRLDAEERS